MTQPPQPPQQPQQPGNGYPAQPGYGYPSYPQPGASAPGYPPPGHLAYAMPKKRPSAWWFLPGTLAVALALACTAVSIVVGVRMFHTDGYLPADGRAHAVDVPAGDRMLFAPDGAVPHCSVRGAEGAVAVEYLSASDSESIAAGGLDWYPFARFSSAGPSVSIACTGSVDQVRVGAPAGDTQWAIVGFSIIGALGLGLLGVVGLIIVLVLYISRRPQAFNQSISG